MKLTLRWKLAIAMIGAGLLPLALASVALDYSVSAALAHQAFDHLESARDARKSQIQDYFQQIEHQLVTLSRQPATAKAMTELRAGLLAMPAELRTDATRSAEMRARLASYYEVEVANRLRERGATFDVMSLFPTATDTVVAQHEYAITVPAAGAGRPDTPARPTSYGEAHRRYHDTFREYQERFGHGDILLVDPATGTVVYTVVKGLDFATNLITGPFADANIGLAFARTVQSAARDHVNVADFEPYLPSYADPAGFASYPIYRDSDMIGILMFRLDTGRINEIMQQPLGFGSSGETYLVGADNKMRSQSRLEPDGTPLTGEVDSMGAARALMGQEGQATIIGRRGVSVLSSFTPIAIDDLSWALVAEVDEAAALAAPTGFWWPLFSLTALTMLSVLAGAVVFSRTFSAPITRTVNTLQAIANGDLHQRLILNTGDEFEELAQALNVSTKATQRALREVEATAAANRRLASDAAVASAAKSEFLATMSHELRTPMNAIIGFSAMATKRGQRALSVLEPAHPATRPLIQQSQYIQQISTSADGLLNLINQILDLSKVEAGRMELFNEEVSVAAILAQVQGPCEQLMSKNSNKFTIDCRDNNAMMLTDLTKVRQILINLVGNAAKFTENGTITLRVRPDTIRSKDDLIFQVIDTGIGMTPDQTARIFDAFTQADSSTTRRFGGTGMGLTIVRSLVSLLHGSVHVESVHHRGTTFTVRLPRKQKTNVSVAA